MNRFLTALLALAILASFGCAKAPIVKNTSPRYFAGFEALPSGEARLLFYRGAKILGPGWPMLVTVENCQFEIAFWQFAVCNVSPGRADIAMANSLDTVDVPAGGWACVTFKITALRGPRFKPIDCLDLTKKLKTNRQV